ncbi:hypothetical protein ARMSODRAFT_989179 [Armillaria solidipes]|uniref:Uncharacterized protein n=1 Tax=Armillaria solidipes TaxID=1076256 RepID=A0A2H3BRY8_9AGAR|nr:hypothetical protein ARMSODRAFT_989179 [Armillaria solidipes]
MLFADDTTVYLAKTDNMWCSASGAKFNIEKTKVILIGSSEYCNTVLAMRKLSARQESISGDIHIVQDGDTIRILGAFIENNIDRAAPWSLILDRLAQGMPNTVQLQLQKMIGNFTWDNQRKVLVNPTILAAAINKGGMQVLNISIRNQVIKVMRLQSYLSLDANRPKAAYRNLRSAAMMNTILQT